MVKSKRETREIFHELTAEISYFSKLINLR